MGSLVGAQLTVYGSQVSYFTGKFETYLRYKEIPYRYRALDLRMYYWVLPRALGATQYPSVQLPDGRWMSDTTPMIAWLEREHPEAPVMPEDPVQRYVALLIEDYADEWLWRPAMHFRWSFADDRRLAAASLAREVVRLPLPAAIRQVTVARRQTKLFVHGDGIDARTRVHAERSVGRVFACLEPVLTRRPFVFGERPTIADIGLMGPFWRHFVHDPTPARLLAGHGPGDVRVGRPHVERPGQPRRRSSTARRRAVRPLSAPARDRRHASSGARPERGRPRTRCRDARPHRAGHDIPRRPDEPIPGVVPRAAPVEVRRARAGCRRGDPGAA